MPFVPKVASGDADISDNLYDEQGQINTSLEGEIKIKMKMAADVSKIEIKPDFETTLIEDQTITLTPNNTISLSGNMDFGDVKINEGKGELLTIENNTTEVLNITSISLPVGYSHTWEEWKTEPIEPKGYKSFLVVFEPTKAEEYKGTITIGNNLDDINNKIPVIGNGTDDKITLEGSLDFGNVDINTSTNAMPSKSFYISNYNLNRSINVDPINNLPEGFTATDGWVNGGELGPGAKQEVVITFNPTVAKDYGNTIEVINDLDQINNKIAVTGKGFDSNLTIDGVWKATYLDQDACTRAKFINNKEFVFESTDANNGAFSFNTLPNTKDVYITNTFELNNGKLEIILETEYYAGPDRITREFTFSGKYNIETDTYSGDFYYKWKHYGGQTRICSGSTLEFSRL